MTAPMRLTLSSKAIFDPLVDFILTSGLSIAVMFGLVVTYIVADLSAGTPAEEVLPKLLILQVLVNWPHFLVSYRLLYGRAQNIRDFPMAAIGVPIILLGVCTLAVLPAFGGSGLFEANLRVSYVLWLFAALYLAWHYTGQTWGVMMIFCHLEGVRFTQVERQVIRAGFRALIVWHVIWGIGSLPDFAYIAPFQGETAQAVANVLAVCAFVSGAAILLRKLAALRRLDLRIVGAWAALYSWYLVLWLLPAAFVFVQLSHALQYLVFPARVELNRPRAGSAVMRVGAIYATCVLGGVIVFHLPDTYLLSASGAPSFFSLVAIAINIHHYYTDGAIWKMRDAHVRDSLLGHAGAPACR